MPSFDVISEVNLTEVKNSTNLARKELANRFDFKGIDWEIEDKDNTVIIAASEEFKIDAIREILMGKFAKRDISLKNIDIGKKEISSVGRGRQILTMKQGLESDVAKQLCKDIRATGFKIQAQQEGGKIRVTGKKRDDLQKIIAYLKGRDDLSCGLTYENFRD
ncbi:MAG: YajQ family cyclic di-GMP-binding protein [Verrucomicrobiota bacterium]